MLRLFITTHAMSDVIRDTLWCLGILGKVLNTWANHDFWPFVCVVTLFLPHCLLYESSRGNQVDGLPLVAHTSWSKLLYACRRIPAQDARTRRPPGTNVWQVNLCVVISLDPSFCFQRYLMVRSGIIYIYVYIYIYCAACNAAWRSMHLVESHGPSRMQNDAWGMVGAVRRYEKVRGNGKMRKHSCKYKPGVCAWCYNAP